MPEIVHYSVMEAKPAKYVKTWASLPTRAINKSVLNLSGTHGSILSGWVRAAFELGSLYFRQNQGVDLEEKMHFTCSVLQTDVAYN